jgi:hypothetical protein
VQPLQSPLYVEVLQYGLPMALWHEIQRIKLIETVDNRCEKRDQGLSVGIYIAILQSIEQLLQ